MSALEFSVTSARAEPYAMGPLVVLRLRIEETSGARIHALALRIQVQLEPQRRRYTAPESAGLVELFGEPTRYGDTLKPMLWTHVSQLVPAFEGATEVDVLLPCSYDFEVAANKYLAALEDGEVPVNLLFSGTIFVRGEREVSAELVPWDREARFRLPVALWREAIDAFFPNTAWIRIDRGVFAELHRFKTANALPTWDAVLERLCEQAKVAR